MTDGKRFVEKNTMLVREFDRYMLEHPEFADELPDNSFLIMQLEGDEEFNRWARQTGKKCAEDDTPIVHVTVTRLKPLRSRIEKLRFEKVA